MCVCVVLLLFLFNCFSMAIGAYKKDEKVRDKRLTKRQEDESESERAAKTKKFFSFHLMRVDVVNSSQADA